MKNQFVLQGLRKLWAAPTLAVALLVNGTHPNNAGRPQTAELNPPKSTSRGWPA